MTTVALQRKLRREEARAAHRSAALAALEREVHRMGEVVEAHLDGALAALTRRDTVLAEEVLRGDDEVDGFDVRIEEAGLQILAAHRLEPAEVRLVFAAVRIDTQLERVGDLAVNLAERALSLALAPPLAALADVARMGERVQEMLHVSLEALARRDAAQARSVLALDALVDELHRGLFRKLEALMREEPGTVERAVPLLSCSRSLERIGDHAKNVAEDVVALVEGQIVRHPNRNRARPSTDEGIMIRGRDSG